MSIALRAFYALVIALLLAPLPVNAQDAKIGVTAVVNPNATGQPPSQARRTLLIGSSVFSQENVITTEKGQAQMLFLDESALTIGPNSEVVLDEFVYDPNTKTGKLALTATKGLFRLVGGRISKTNPVILKTPTATIGIRGGIAMVNAADAGGATTSTFLFGDQMDVTSGGVTKSVTRPGFTITVTAPNVPPSDPIPATSDQLSGALSSLEGSSEPAGDSENTPTDDSVAASGVTAGSESDPGAIAPTGDTGGGVGTGATVADGAEGTAEKNENSQTTATNNVSGGLSGLTGLVGRFKHSTSITQGSDDGSGGNFNSPFSNANVSGGTFTVTLPSSNTLTFPVQAASAGPLSFTSASGATGPLNGSSGLAGTSTVFSGNQFVVLEAAEVSDSHASGICFRWHTDRHVSDRGRDVLHLSQRLPTRQQCTVCPQGIRRRYPPRPCAVYRGRSLCRDLLGYVRCIDSTAGIRFCHRRRVGNRNIAEICWQPNHR